MSTADVLLKNALVANAAIGPRIIPKRPNTSNPTYIEIIVTSG